VPTNNRRRKSRSSFDQIISAISMVSGWYWAIVAGLTGVGLIALFAGPLAINGANGLRDIMDILARTPVLAGAAIVVIIAFVVCGNIAIVKGIYGLVRLVSDYRKADRKATTIEIDGRPPEHIRVVKESAQGSAKYAEIMTEPVSAVDVEVPLPPSPQSSTVFGEREIIGDPIRAIVEKVKHQQEPVTIEVAEGLQDAIFCSVVLKLHEGKTEDDTSQLVAAIMPAGSIPNLDLITELAAKTATKFHTVAGVDARMHREGSQNKPLPTSSMRIYVDPSLFNHGVAIIPAGSSGKWHAIPTSSFKGGGAETLPVASAIYEEPEQRPPRSPITGP